MDYRRWFHVMERNGQWSAFVEGNENPFRSFPTEDEALAWCRRRAAEQPHDLVLIYAPV